MVCRYEVSAGYDEENCGAFATSLTGNSVGQMEARGEGSEARKEADEG